MSLSASSNRPLLIGGIAAVVLVLAAAWFFWLRPAARLKAPSDDLLDRLVAAHPDRRDDLIIELGRRGPQVIPQVEAAYEKAADDPVLRTQLATVIFRTNSPAEAAPALERLKQKEKDPGVQASIQGFILGLERLRAATP